MFRVIKRDGKRAPFDVKKIVDAMERAFHACRRKYTEDIIEMLALRVTSDFQNKITDQNTIGVEDIQDSVEKVLSEAGYYDVAKTYILYRKKRENIRNIHATNVDSISLVDDYLSALDWKNDNDSKIYSIGGLIASNSAAISANYWLSQIFDSEISEAHQNGDIHIHDLRMLTGSCAGWSLKELSEKGLGGVEGRVTAGPSKHLNTMVSQMVHFTDIMQNEWAGAQSFSSFDTILAPFIKADQMSYQDIKQNMQELIYSLNTPSRYGTQECYTTIDFDWTVPEDKKNEKVVICGEEKDFTYGECEEEMRLINQAFIEVMLEGDYQKRPFSYPHLTYRIAHDFDWSDDAGNKQLFELALTRQNITLMNEKAIHRKPISQMKTFRTNVLYEKLGGADGSGEKTGEIGEVSINLVRLAGKSETKEQFFTKLDELCDISARALHTKRIVLSKLLESGLYPYTKQYLDSFDHHFSSIALVGMYEAKEKMTWVEDSDAFTIEMLNRIQNRLYMYQKMYHEPFALKATRAEQVRIRFAAMDQAAVSSYTNSTWEKDDMDLFDALIKQEKLQPFYNSNTVFEAVLKEDLDWSDLEILLKRIVKKFDVPYIRVKKGE